VLAGFAALSLLTVLVAGCAEKDFAALRPGLETRGSYIEGVPFYRQSEPTCGAAALAGMLEYRGHPEDLERITGKIYRPDLKDAPPMDMERYAREAGFKAESSSGSFGELKAYIRKGTPVICLLDIGFGFDHKPLYVMVIGFDDVHEVFIVHDGSAPNGLIGYKKFNKKWIRAGYWMLVIEQRRT
jgi:ABC-type bacteriocin/lantibiotic exporter with double-glycine peptidase domain